MKKNNYKAAALAFATIVMQIVFVSGPVLITRAQTTDVSVADIPTDTADAVSASPSDIVAPDNSAPVVEESVPADAIAPVVSDAPSVSSEPIQAPALSTDKADYSPSQTASIFGNFFQSFQNLILKIFGGSTDDGTYTESQQNITADNQGSFTTSYTLDNIFRPFYTVIANSTTDGTELARMTFTDSPADDIDQCANGGVGNPVISPCNWVNGNVNQTKAHYVEGQSVPYHIIMSGLSTSGSHTLVIGFDVKQSGKFALDYITSNDRISETVNPCLKASGPAVSLCVLTSPVPADIIPSPSGYTGSAPAGGVTSATSFNNLVTAEGIQRVKIYNGNITGVSYTTNADMNAASSEARVTITFTATNSTVVVSWGGHISKNSDYPGLSAVSLSGSPYHTRLNSLDGSGGNQDKQLAAAAVLPPQAISTLTLIKTVTNDNGGGAAATAWTLSASGPTPISGITGSGAVTGVTVDAGTYALSETGGPSGYAASAWSCIGGSQSGSNITLASGESATCTITNDDIAPTLTLVKTVVNDNGGTATTASFQGKIDGNNVAWGSPIVLNAGAHTASETNLAGYAASNWGGDCAANGSVALATGDNKTCTITNNDQPGHLILVKHLPNDNGGTATQNDFTPSIDNGAAVWGDNTVNAGSHQASETNLPGYTPSDWSNACDAQGNVFLLPGETKTCEITNDDNAPKLTLVKQVVNDNGGGATSADWTLSAAGYDANSPDAGTYNLSESNGPAGYAQTSLTCNNAQGEVSSVTLGLGDNVTCTFVNDDITPQLIVIKHVINNNGGTADANNFTMIVTANNPSPASFSGDESGTTVILNAGAYGVTESGLSGYTQSFSPDCSGSIAVGETKTCTITNDDQPGTLHVVKVLPNDNGGTATKDQFSFSVNGDNAVAFEVDGQNDLTVDAGTYNVTETNPMNGYVVSYNNCSNIVIPNGGEATCTITNDDVAPTLTLVKVVVNDNGGTLGVSNFPLFISENPVTSGDVNTLNAGSYTASETNQTGYAAGAWGGDCDSQGNVILNVGDNKTCTIINNDIAPQLVVMKHVINDSGNVAVASDFTMLVNGTNVSSSSFLGSESGVTVTLNAGNYSADEGNHAGYTKTLGVDCSGTIAIGETKTCAITNDDVPPATRTLGFWQTHTNYTAGVFAGFGGTLQIGTKVVSSTSKFFAGFYASISKTSAKVNRSAINQARIQLLQQWLAAKLNCQAFGCSNVTQTLLINAANAWTTGPASLILSYANQLDIYNNSNDALSISGQGKATPSISQSTAINAISFWDILP